MRRPRLLARDRWEVPLLRVVEREAEQHAPQLAGERARRLTAVDTKIRNASFREELIVTALEANGVQADRRGDAEPSVVLTVALAESSASAA